MSKRKIAELEDQVDESNVTKLLKSSPTELDEPSNLSDEAAIIDSNGCSSAILAESNNLWNKGGVAIVKGLNFASGNRNIGASRKNEEFGRGILGLSVNSGGSDNRIICLGVDRDESGPPAGLQLANIAPAKRISKRSIKKRRGGKVTEEALADEEAVGVGKRRRTWELWSADDKFIFFEALNEFGKDFDKIQAHFQSKLKHKTRNLPAHLCADIKNKNQIRHFYYRTWHKISNYINFSSELNKNTKELYGLINYGELWKKIGGTVDDKFGAKLDDLVQKGSAAVKIKGKTQRVKTPVCRALKKLSAGTEPLLKSKVAKSRLPGKVVLELRPRTTCDWCRVQRMAQNPHLRVVMGVQRRLGTLVRCLEKKWRSYETKLRGGLVVRREEEEGGAGEKQLVILPPRGVVIKESREEKVVSKRPKVKIKLSGFEEEVDEGGLEVVGIASRETVSCDSQEEGSKFEEMLRMQRLNVGIDLAVDNDDNSNDEPRSSPKNDIENLEDAEDIGAEEFLLDESDQECSRSPIPQPDLEASDQSDAEIIDYIREDEEDQKVEKEDDDVMCKADIDDEDKLETWTDPKDGWTVCTAADLTVGQIFLMLTPDTTEISCDTRSEVSLRLDYTWRGEEEAEEGGAGDLLARLVKLANGAGKGAARGRSTSQSSGGGSPCVRSLGSPQGASLRSPVGPGRGGLMLSPVSRGLGGPGASKQIQLPGLVVGRGADKPGSPLAVPLEGAEHEFRKPLAPPATRQGAMSAAFREQIGQYLPKFSNRRGRQSRNRAKQVVGRQLLHPLQPAQPVVPHNMPQLVHVVQKISSDSLTTQDQGETLSPGNTNGTGETLSPVMTVAPPAQGSPPQISIPSPSRRSPSPTPSFSSLMDLTFPESTPSTPTKENFLGNMYHGDNSLLQTPPRPAPTPSPRILPESQDLSLSSWSINFESPLKNLSSVTLGYNEDSQTSTISNSSELDRQLSAMMCENSIDFTSKFARLAKHVAGVADQDQLPS